MTRRVPVKTALVGLLFAPGAMAQQAPDQNAQAPDPTPPPSTSAGSERHSARRPAPTTPTRNPVSRDWSVIVEPFVPVPPTTPLSRSAIEGPVWVPDGVLVCG